MITAQVWLVELAPRSWAVIEYRPSEEGSTPSRAKTGGWAVSARASGSTSRAECL